MWHAEGSEVLGLPYFARVTEKGMKQRSFAPVWLMGLTYAVFGMYGGIVVISIPQLLSARHVPAATIASMTAIILSPGFWTFIVSPVLDVRFSRRWYSVVTAVLAAFLLVLALINLNNLVLVKVCLVAGYFMATLYTSALGGWLSTITTAEEKNKLSVWVTVGNFGGGGVMAIVTGELVLHLTPAQAALVLGAALLMPIAVFPWMPAPGPDRRLARESFSQFFGEIVSLLSRREVLIAILFFISPAATFSLTNFLSGVGNDFRASTHLVGLVGGAGVFLGGVTGCFGFRLIDRLLPLRFLYLAIGVAGALFTLGLVLVPHVSATFAIAMIGENMFQALAFTALYAITFETIGPSNPLAATTFCVMTSASSIPITYMLFVDAYGYGHHGVVGSLWADAGLSLLACLMLGAFLVWFTKRNTVRPSSPVEASVNA